MQLYCKGGIVVATHDDAQNVPASAYGDGVTIISYDAAQGPLARFGDLPEGWTEEALDPRPYEAPAGTFAPRHVTRAQAKLQLHRSGILDQVKAAVAADPEVQIWFDEAATWERNNPHVVALGEALLGGGEAIDAMFAAAAQIAV